MKLVHYSVVGVPPDVLTLKIKVGWRKRIRMACKDCTIDFNTPAPKSLQNNKSLGLVIAGIAGMIREVKLFTPWNVEHTALLKVL